MAIKIVEIEVTEPLRPVWGLEGYDRVRMLVRHEGEPLGWAEVAPLRRAALSAAQAREAIDDYLGWAVARSILTRDVGRPVADDTKLPPISVVICTRDRPEQLAGCLRAVLDQDYPSYDVLVVDNAPRTDATKQLIEAMPVRYVREPRPGLDWARNRGIAEVHQPIVAYTDDDARPDRGWLRAIGRAFLEPEVMAVTGPALPAELETRAQILFELVYGGMSHGFRRRVIRASTTSTRDRLWASSFGVGANMAFRRSVFDEVGLFDPALDVGTPSGGAGDVEMFHRLVARGQTLVYEPSAFVWHRHRRDMGSLRRQLFDNGRGFGSYLITCGRNRTVGRGAIARFALLAWVGGWIIPRLRRPNGLPRHLVVCELAGAMVSPIAYRKAQAAARSIERAFADRSEPGGARSALDVHSCRAPLES